MRAETPRLRSLPIALFAKICEEALQNGDSRLKIICETSNETSTDITFNACIICTMFCLPRAIWLAKTKQVVTYSLISIKLYL